MKVQRCVRFGSATARTSSVATSKVTPPSLIACERVSAQLLHGGFGDVLDPHTASHATDRR